MYVIGQGKCLIEQFGFFVACRKPSAVGNHHMHFTFGVLLELLMKRQARCVPLAPLIPTTMRFTPYSSKSGSQCLGSTSLNWQRWKRSFWLYGTVQSKMTLQAMPWSRIEGEHDGSFDGSSGWQRTPGIVTISTSACILVVIAHSTSLVSKYRHLHQLKSPASIPGKQRKQAAQPDADDPRHWERSF